MEGGLYKSIGRRIRRARESLKLSQEELASRMGYSSAATISHFETGLRKISIADLRRLSELLGIPLDQLVEGEDTVREFQRFRLRATTTPVMPAARTAVSGFLAFAQKHSRETPRIPDSIRHLTPGAAAEGILAYLQIEEPPVSPREVAQNLGVHVFDWDFPDEISGIVVMEEGTASIGVNYSHPNVRQRFTIAHELGHLVFHEERDLFVDFTEMEMSPSFFNEDQQHLETKANQFAADLLMPKGWIREDFRRLGEGSELLLAQRYEVSGQAIWFRLLNLRLVSDEGKEVSS